MWQVSLLRATTFTSDHSKYHFFYIKNCHTHSQLTTPTHCWPHPLNANHTHSMLATPINCWPRPFTAGHTHSMLATPTHGSVQSSPKVLISRVNVCSMVHQQLRCILVSITDSQHEWSASHHIHTVNVTSAGEVLEHSLDCVCVTVVCSCVQWRTLRDDIMD